MTTEPNYAAEIEKLRAELRKAIQLCSICCDWHLEEVEIDGEMIDTRDLSAQFEAALEAAA